MAGSFNQECQAHQEIVMPLSRVNIEIDGLAGSCPASASKQTDAAALRGAGKR